MGTNFYWVMRPSGKGDGSVVLPTGEILEFWPEDRDDPRIHIGKRNAAGFYCWDCGMTLCAQGEHGAHEDGAKWHAICPKCGKNPTPRATGNPVEVELGFSNPRAERPNGVCGCHSFSWAHSPQDTRRFCEARPNEKIVEDGYGREYTGSEFLAMLAANCPIEFTDLVGKRFA